VVPGSAFGAPGYIRLSFAAATRTLEDALGRMRRALAGAQALARA
jgi:aspartate aminotransferase